VEAQWTQDMTSAYVRWKQVTDSMRSWMRLFWVISRCGFFMHQVSHSQDSRTSPVDFNLHHYHFWLRSSDGPLGRDLRVCDVRGWFDNGLIVRHLANEEISAKGSQP
jgi:hypothetical protein